MPVDNWSEVAQMPTDVWKKAGKPKLRIFGWSNKYVSKVDDRNRGRAEGSLFNSHNTKV